jgi:site-specific recombinase XerD
MTSDKQKLRFEPVGEVVSIFQRGRRWYANYQVDGKQLRRSLKTTSKKEARRRAIQLEAEIIEGRYQRTPRPPALADAVESYKQHNRTEGKAKKTLVKYDKVLQRLLGLAERRRARTIQDVDRILVDRYRDERVQAGIAPKTLYNETVIIRQLVNFALSRGLIVMDPLKGLHLKKPKPTTQPCWTPEEMESIFAAAPASERAKFVVLAGTGMRVGELRHLTWDDIDLDRNLLHIRAKDGWQPKTGDQRAVPLTTRVRQVLQSLPRRGRWVFTAASSAQYPRGDHQFSDRHLLTSLKRVLKRLKLPGHVHTFRHAFISHALTQGIPEAIVKQWVGHVDAEIIKLYTHIADQASQAAMQRLDGANQQHLQSGGSTDGDKKQGGGSTQKQHSKRRPKNG